MMQGAPDQVRALLTDEPWRSPLLAPFRRISANVPPDQARISRAALGAYKEKAAPAFSKLLRYLTETYVPGARESISLGALPGGAAWYAYSVRRATTTNLTPQQIHEIGLSEVKRIRAEMDKVIAGTGFQGSFSEFVRFLHSDPRFFFVNTYDLKARPKWEMEALALHECIPGHHLQVSIAQEIKGVPRGLNYHDYTAFVEGWGLYAETLGDEMGFYRDPYFKFGQLTYEMWRAVRLVVDTGIHSRGWTKQQATDYFRDNTAQDDRAIAAEVNRYISSPRPGPGLQDWGVENQRAARLRTKRAGTGLRPPRLHVEVLRHGAVPLDLLERNVETWMAAGRPRLETGR